MNPHALAHEVATELHTALPAEAGLDVDAIAELLAPPPKADMGDMSFPCFRLAKALKNAPPKIAAQLADAINARTDSLIDTAEPTGPYLNLRLRPHRAAEVALTPWAKADRPEYPASSEKIMIEYSQPNTHKAFHVGHMRNVAVGDALVRLLRATGHEVVAANYFGDVGTHIARCLWGYTELLTDEEREPPAEGRGEWLGEIYARSTITLEDWKEAGEKGDEEAKAKYEAARKRMGEILKAVENREPELTALWDRTRKWSLEEFDEIYAWLGVHFDRLFYESEVDEPSLELVEEYLKKGVFVEDDGAVGIRNPEIKHMPFLLLRKRDGTGLYATKDLALARIKFEEFQIDRSIYVVDVRQSDHFKHVFLTLEKMGFEQAKQCEHVPYEMVELSSGPMSGRKGTVVLFRSLREQMAEALSAEEYLGKHEGEWPAEELAEAKRALSLGAIKYGMLARDLNQKIVFDMSEWLSPEGNTGPYLQYAAARACSILDKAEAMGKRWDPETPLPEGALVHPAEKVVLRELAGLGGAVEQAARQLRPSILCTHLHGLAQAYNSFQNNKECNVIHSEGAVLQGRLALVRAVREALTWGLDLLGIPAPRRV
jgi:arginyl-tRNA synthetase